jgi:crotonobetainyl-CoA:carnitine CoA-transferase CaiB-like acyl-CoA transferase
LFKAGKGYLLLAVNSEKQYRALMVALGQEDALKDPRFADWFSRQENEPALRAIIEDGHYMEVDVDIATGEVLNVDRS